MANEILVIAPYWLDSVGTWVFDDDAVDLVQEPFVSGVPRMIDELEAIGEGNCQTSQYMLLTPGIAPQASAKQPGYR